MERKLVQYKDHMHEREVKANRFHCDEVHELRDRILSLVDELKEKEKYYESVE